MAWTLVLLSPALTAESTVAPQSLIEKALLIKKGEKVLPRYTYFMLEHVQNRNQKGKLFLDVTTLYEYTWIGDLPYGRVVERQGKPLKGKDLAEEQARYDQALADHAGLDTGERARAKHYTVVDTSLRLEPLLTPAYTLREIRREILGGDETHVIECTPNASGSPDPAATRHVTLWITDAGVILRNAYELVADEPGKLRGSHGQDDFQLIDGNPLPEHRYFHLNAPNGNSGDFESSYSRFRRFNASMRIVPDASSEAPENNPTQR